MGKSTRVRCPSDETGSASRDGAATAAAHQPRLDDLAFTKPLPTPEEPGKQHRSAAAVAAMRAVAAPDENDSVFVRLGAWGFFLPLWLCCGPHVSASKQRASLEMPLPPLWRALTRPA